MQTWDELSTSQILKELVEVFQEYFTATLKTKKKKKSEPGTDLNILGTDQIRFFLGCIKYSKENCLKTNAF